jgi:EAL domain-containing protein (putative c-di-GMP-specific phosphodiesterase class I)
VLLPRTITMDTSTTTIVEMLVALARDFHMTVVAEGIETEEQVRALISRGVEEGQGYLVAAPLPFTGFSELVAARRAACAAAAPVDDAVLVA